MAISSEPVVALHFAIDDATTRQEDLYRKGGVRYDVATKENYYAATASAKEERKNERIRKRSLAINVLRFIACASIVGFRERRRINRKCLLRNRAAADVRKGEHEEISR